MDKPGKGYLNFTLYQLHYVHDVKSPDAIKDKMVNQMPKVYAKDKLVGAYRALQWAVDNDDYDLSENISVRQDLEDVKFFINRMKAVYEETILPQLGFSEEEIKKGI